MCEEYHIIPNALAFSHIHQHGLLTPSPSIILRQGRSWCIEHDLNPDGSFDRISQSKFSPEL